MTDIWVIGFGVTVVVWVISLLFAVGFYLDEQSKENARIALGVLVGGAVVAVLWPAAVLAGIGVVLTMLFKDAFKEE